MIIYNTDDTELLDAIITASAEHEEELMKSDFIKFSFSTDVRMTLPVGAYIVFNGLKYRLSEPYQPSQESEIEFKYEPQFHHPKMWLGKVVFVFDTTDTTGKAIKQQVWDYNGFTGTLLQYVVDAINEAFGFAEEDKFNYSIIGEVDNTVSVSFSNTDILSAISAIASACKDNQCEWHLDWTDKSLYFGQLAYNRGEETPVLKVGENVGKASVSTSNDGYYNVFLPEGSTRNMSIKAASGENVSTGIRLGLNETDYPDGKIYVSPAGDIITKAAFEASGVPAQTLGLTFDDVYPHVDLYAYNIRKRTRYLLDDSGKMVVDHYDGENPVYKTYTVWYMRLAYPTIQGGNVTGWTDYTLDVDKQVLDGYKPMITFKANTSEGALSSSLAGQPTSGDGFEIVYHKAAQTIPASEATGDSGVEVKAGDYEIVFVKQGENDMIVPTNEDAGLIPRGEATPSLKGNIVVLYNIAMGANEVLAAQKELLEKTKKEIARRFSDLNNYTVQSYPHVFEKANPNLYVGQKVVFNNGGYQLTTRVTKLVTKIDYNFIQTVTVGNQQIKGSISQLKEDVKTIMSGNFSGAGINQTQALNLIKNYVGSRYLSKLSPDTAQGLITFLQGLYAKAKSFFTGINNTGEINNTGDIYNTGDIHNDGDVLTRNLTVTGKATFFELEILKAKAAGGMTIESPGTFHADIVEETDAGYVLYQRAEQDGKTLTQMIDEKDQLFSCDFNLGTGNYTDAGNHYYWRLVTAAPTEYVTKTINEENVRCLTITLSKTDCAESSGVPKAGDDLMVLGNRDDSARQNAIMTSAYRSFDQGLDCPYTCQYSGINDYNLTSHRKTWFAAKGNRIKGDLIMESTGVSVKDALDELNSYISEVGDQVDDKIQFWFFPYQPSAGTAPTSSWTTDDVKDAHVGDLFYDTARGGSYGGGTCYKWTKTVSEDGTATYAWVEVTDAQTIAALEKIADISSDGVISGGTERTMLHNQWRAAKADYFYYGAQAFNMGLKDAEVYKDFTKAYNDLAVTLNGGIDIIDESKDPLFASTENISKDYRFSDYDGITPGRYRNAWNTWSDRVSALAVAIQAATDNKVEALADDGIISAGTEKQQLEQAWARVTSEYAQLVASASGFKMNEETDPAHDTYNTYTEKYRLLGEVVTPMLSDSSIGQDSIINDKAAYQKGWKDYYAAASNLEEALFDRGKTLTEGAQSDADAAQDAINDIVSDGMLDPTEKQTVKRDFCYYHDERKAMHDIAKCGQEEVPSTPVDVLSALNKWEEKFSALATMLNNGANWSYTVDTQLTNENMPLWLNAENISLCTDITDIGRDTYRNTWINFLKARTALLNAVTEYARVIAESAADADYSVNVFVTEIGEGMPNAAHKGDTWKQAVQLTNPYDENVPPITQDDDGNTLYNVYLCNETYDSSNSGNQSDYWTPISTPTYTAIKKLDDKILLEVIDEEGGSRIKSTAKSVSIQVASSQSRNLLKGGWLEYTGWGYGGVLTKQGSRLSVMLEAGKTYTITARGRMPKNALYVYNRKALVLSNGTTANTTPVFYYISGTDVQSSVTEYYLATSASSGVTRGTSGWSTSLPTMSDTNMYLWNYRVVVCSNGYSFSSPAVLVYTYTGSAPVGVTEYYLGYNSNYGATVATDGWSTSPVMPNNVERMVVHVYNGSTYPGAAVIKSTSMSVVSHTFTPTVTQTYYIDAFPQDANGTNAAYRWREWALEWVVLTAGEVPATEWTDSEADVLATGFDIKKGEINTTASKFTLSDNNGTKRITSEDGNVVVDFDNFKIDKDGNVTATNGNFSGTVTASGGVIGNLEINQNAIEYIDANSGFWRVLSPNAIQYYTSIENHTCLVDVPSPGLMAISRGTSASFIIGKGAISVQMGGYDGYINGEYKEFPCYTAYIRDPSTTSLSSDFTTMKSIGVGFATNGRMVANVFQSLKGGLAMVAMSWGTINSDGTLGGNKLFAFQTNCYVSSVQRINTGRYTCTLSDTPKGWWTVLLTARPSNSLPMYVTLLEKSGNTFTVCTSDDETTNDCGFEYIIVSFGGI